MSDLEKNNNGYLIKQQNKTEGRILQKLEFIDAINDACGEVVVNVHDGYSLSITPDFEIDEDGHVHKWLKLVGGER